MDMIMAELKNVEWAQPLLREIKANGGLCVANMARFFELRQGYALHRAGIKPSYEIAGEEDLRSISVSQPTVKRGMWR